MNHYTKLAVLAMRSMGLIILCYATPIVVWGALRLVLGTGKASDGVTSNASALIGWVMYGLAGFLLMRFASPLGRIAARGLDEATRTPPAA